MTLQNLHTEITRADIEMALRNMKNGKVTGPENLPVGVSKTVWEELELIS